MFSRDALLAMHAWTHDCLDRLYAHAASLPAGSLSREMEGFGMPTLHEQLAHMQACERYWAAVAFGHYEGWRQLEPGTMAELVAERSQIAAQTRAWLEAASAEQLNASAPLEGTPHAGEQVTPAMLLYHAFTHYFHHKGQAVAMCRLLGHPAPDTDVAWD